MKTKRWNRIKMSLFGAVMSLSFITPVLAAAGGEELVKYSPVDIQNHWAEDSIYDLLYSNGINGSTDKEGSVFIHPDRKITRAEFASMLVKSKGLAAANDAPARDFADIKEESWYYGAVRTASALGIVSGVDNSHFAPERTIRRDEMAAMVLKAFTKTVDFTGEPLKFKDVPDYWAKDAILKVSAAEVVKGFQDGTFRPSASASRAEGIAMILRAIQAESVDLPADADLEKIAADSENEALAAIQANDFAKLDEISNKYYIGFEKALVGFSSEQLKSMKEQGYTVNVTKTGEIKAKLYVSSTARAIVELSGASYETIVKKGDIEKKVKTDLNGDMYFTKDPTTSEWKIYLTSFDRPATNE